MSFKILQKTAVTFGFLLMAITGFTQQIARFKKGDRVVFTGNSITDGGRYHSYIWLYYLTRYPNMPIKVFNAGIGGDVARQIDERLQDDVFSKKPTVITLTFGMNDTGYQSLKGKKADSVYAEKINTSYQSFLNIEKKLKAYPQVRKIMIGSSAYDETSKIKTNPITGKNAAILKIIALQQQAAQKNGWDFVDFNQPMVKINREQQLHDSLFTMQGTDRIHPTNDGHMVMAYLFLKAQGFAGKKVAEADINLHNKSTKAENCTVSSLAISFQTISFNYLAKSLPYPLDTIAQNNGKPATSQASATKLVPFIPQFNQENLKVIGLKSDQNYELKIDNTVIGKWSGNNFIPASTSLYITLRRNFSRL
jgi:lysophospholipase L1-like esterase